MTHVFHAGNTARAQLCPLHHAGVQLHLAVRVEARADPGVEERFVLHVPHGGNRGRERAVSDEGPAEL